MSNSRQKISITLSPELLERVDKEAAKMPKGTRSSVIESWLRSAARLKGEASLAADTIAYYESRSKAERAEDVAMAVKALSKKARKLKFD